MSDLVEKVAKAMCLSCGVDPDFVSDGKVMWHRFIPDARAAIKCVAEWLNDEQGEPKNLIFQEAVNTLLSHLYEKPHE